MNILFLNGSPRPNSNTRAALEAIAKGMQEKNPTAAIKILNVSEFHIAPCHACDSCQKNGGTCVIHDDTPAIVQEIVDADLIIFGSPVYWWGISSQLKMVLDRSYARAADLMQAKKSIGSVAVGGAELDDPEYRIIRDQFRCIGDYLGYCTLFHESISAGEAGELAMREQELIRLQTTGSNAMKDLGF